MLVSRCWWDSTLHSADNNNSDRYEFIPEISHYINEYQALQKLSADCERDFELTITGKKLEPIHPNHHVTQEQLETAFQEAFPNETQRLIAIKLAAQRSSEAAITQWKIACDPENQYLMAPFDKNSKTHVTITNDARGNPIIKGEIDVCLYEITKASTSSLEKDQNIIKRQILKYEMNWGTQTFTIQ